MSEIQEDMKGEEPGQWIVDVGRRERWLRGTINILPLLQR